jgi:hypothetical protein
MISLEELRAALLTPDPYDGIDVLIRAELANGRRTQAIYDELLPLVPSVRKTPGFTPDADEALLGTLDALTGNCHPDSCYVDPPVSGTVVTTPANANEQDVGPVTRVV